MLDHDLHNPTQIILLLISIDYSYRNLLKPLMKEWQEGFASEVCGGVWYLWTTSVDY